MAGRVFLILTLCVGLLVPAVNAIPLTAGEAVACCVATTAVATCRDCTPDQTKSPVCCSAVAPIHFVVLTDNFDLTPPFRAYAYPAFRASGATVSQFPPTPPPQFS
ncbi:MAG: hypothetical protein WA771_16555 [Chthoniobacterales bacterium]